MTAKVIGKHVWAGFLSFVVWFGLGFICLLILVFVPEYPPQGMWPLWVCGAVAVPAAIYTWRVVFRGSQAHAVSARTQELFLIGLGAVWQLLFVALFVLRTPVSKDAMYAGILAYFIVGPVPVLMALHFAIRERRFRSAYPSLYWPAVLLGLSPVFVFCLQVFL